MQIKLFKFNNFISIIVLPAILLHTKSADCGSNLHFLTMGSPQILICGESGGNGRTYDLAERYRSCDPFAERERDHYGRHSPVWGFRERTLYPAYAQRSSISGQTTSPRGTLPSSSSSSGSPGLLISVLRILPGRWLEPTP